MQFENTMTFVRALKGAPASVLWALLFTKRMMTALELQQWTGYKGDNITVAVRLLVDLGWAVARSPRGPWGLAEGRQLPLMPGIGQTEALKPPDSDLIGVGARGSSSSSRRSRLSSYLPQEEEETDESDLIGFIAENLAALDEAGIREPKRTKLARLKHVTPEFIKGHIRQVKAECLPIGTAIHRIEYKWSVDPRYERDAKKITFCGRHMRPLPCDVCKEESDDE